MKKNLERYYYEQQDDFSCGPSCIKMLADYKKVKYKNFAELVKICNCHKKDGTTHKGIKNALDTLKLINHRNQYLDKQKKSIIFLDTILFLQHIFIIRTLTKKEKHWAIIYKKVRNKYFVADPWLGLITYNEKQLLAVWRPRAFDGFVVA